MIYYLGSTVLAAAFLLLLRGGELALRPHLEAIRENPFRADALRYRTVFHRTLPRVGELLEFGAPSALCDRSIVIDSAGLRPGLEWRRF